jgi:hypothetical protein
MLGLKFAYATNGKEIVEFDYFTGIESAQPSYPTPAALWERYRIGARIKDQATADRLLTPFQSRRPPGRALLPADSHQSNGRPGPRATSPTTVGCVVRRRSE